MYIAPYCFCSLHIWFLIKSLSSGVMRFMSFQEALQFPQCLDDPTSSSRHPPKNPTQLMSVGAFGMVLCPCCEVFLKAVHRYETPGADRASRWLAAEPGPPIKEPCRRTNRTSFVMICHWLMRSKCHEFRQIPKRWTKQSYFFTVDHGCYCLFRGDSIGRIYRTCQTQQSLHCFKIRCGPCNQFGCWCRNCWWQTKYQRKDVHRLCTTV